MKNHEGYSDPTAAGAVSRASSCSGSPAITAGRSVKPEPWLVRAMDILRPVLSKMDAKSRNHFIEDLGHQMKSASGQDAARKPSCNAVNPELIDDLFRTRKVAPVSTGNSWNFRDLWRPVVSESWKRALDTDGIAPGDTPIVYVCAPYCDADREISREPYHLNLFRAKWYARFAVAQGVIPVVPRLLFPDFLKYDDPYEFRYAVFCCVGLMLCCDEFWVISRCGISADMEEEISYAKRLGLKIRYITDLNQEVTNIERRL